MNGETSMRKWSAGFVLLLGGLSVGCALTSTPRQMYDGPPLPKEQIGTIKSGCGSEGRLNIMVMRVDGKDLSDVCADLSVLPGDHQLDLSAEEMALSLAAPPMASGGVLGAPMPGSGTPQQGPQVVWRSQSPLLITCTVPAGKEVTIVGSRGAGSNWQARCQ